MKALELGRCFFDEIAKPIIEQENPVILELGAIGRFGWGSECLMMDDKISQDHHWGPSINILLPDNFLGGLDDDAFVGIRNKMPEEFMGYRLEAAHVGVPGFAFEGIDAFLNKTIGRTTAPETSVQWLEIPEEDIVHVTNGEVWHDSRGEFTEIRNALQEYYPDQVWKRRMAHNCRYVSGMGIYAVHRALLRNNIPFVNTAFGRTIKLTMELVFMLNRTYYPYDKWLYPMFCELPRLAPAVAPLIIKACDLNRSWEEKIGIVEDIHDLIDQEMVDIGLISAHPKYKKSETSGYRLLEIAYHDLLRQVDPTVYRQCPQTEQVYFEGWVTGFVASQSTSAWEEMLVLEPED